MQSLLVQKIAEKLALDQTLEKLALLVNKTAKKLALLVNKKKKLSREAVLRLVALAHLALRN